MNRLLPFVLCLIFVACKSKKEKKPEVSASDFFPVPSFIRGEVAKLDTSLASFYKIETVDGRSDTTPIKNSEVRRYAADFLDLPDLAAPGLKDDYEVTHLYDDLQEAFVFTFTTKEDHPVKQEDVTVEPQANAAGKNDIKSIYANVLAKEGSADVQKRLLWEVGKGFSTTTLTQPVGGAERIKRTQVIWNGFESEKRGKDSL